ncbi:MAG: hypothetical protein C5B49_12395 [Bdellovibrio sp.]|nr:MAG: hypothetical protein C5B49_12395 [Bdellovibrio sp.]
MAVAAIEPVTFLVEIIPRLKVATAFADTAFGTRVLEHKLTPQLRESREYWESRTIQTGCAVAHGILGGSNGHMLVNQG